MGKEITRQHPLFIKYTRAWLHEVTGYSKGYLCRMATGKMSVSPAFIERVCYRLQLPKGELFSLGGTDSKSEVVKLGGTFYIPKSEIQRATRRKGKEKNGD